MTKKIKNPIVATIAITLFAVLLYCIGVYLKISWLEQAVDKLFTPIATLFVGLCAFILYKKQKDDNKKDIASIILLEIQNAEKVLKTAQAQLEKDPPELPYDAITISTESWSKNKFL